MQIVGVSDVTLGFGSTQIPAFMKFITDYFNEKTTIIEPDQADVPPRSEIFHNIKIHRITTSFNVYTKSGRIEYIARAGALIERLKPEVLVIFTTFCLPVLFKISYKPRMVIYYSLESISSYGEMDVEMNRHIESKVDVIIFPEENRAARFFELCGPLDIPTCIVYNCTNSNEVRNIVPISERNGRMIHQGRLKLETGIDYLLEDRLQAFPIDLYGIVDGKDKEVFMEKLTMLLGGIRYKGILDHQTLEKVRKYYCYGIVYWKPVNENTLYACPNKFFEAIADGIPPITSPHPQCKMLVERYDCGIVMDDWSFDSYYNAIKLAYELQNTEKYYKMVENCKKAINQELNWSSQMDKVKKTLEKTSIYIK